MINMSMPEQETLLQPRIVVFGVGGAGSNAIGNMIRSGLEGVHFVAANTDAQALSSNPASKKLQLGPTVTRGLGAGARPDLGREAAEEQMDEINALLENAHMVFITAGMGGGTGTGAAPVIARAARERGILTVGVVTKPFQFEGAVRMRSAEAGIEQLQQYVDTLIVIPNQNLFNIANEKTTWSEAFKLADDVLYQGVRGVTDLIMTPGQINLDFADIRSVMSEMGKAMMGTGEAEGENRARQAAEMAINNPLLDDASVKGARGVLINITGGPDLTLFEVEEAADRIRDEVDPDANIIFGTAMDENLTGKIRISVVATGIDSIAKRAPLTVVGGNEAPRAGQPQSAYMPSQGQGVAQTAASGTLFNPGVPATATGTTAQAQVQQVRAQSQSSPAVATLAQPSVAGNGMTNFYSGMTAEQVGNTLRAPAQEQPVMRAPAQGTAPVRGTRQGDQFVAPAPVQAGRPAQQMQPSYQVPLQGLMPVEQTMAAQPTARKQGFGERMLGKVKKLVSQLDTEGQGTQPQAQMQQPVQQPRAGYEVSHGGRAGLPPVADEEIDIPSFLRRQAN